ncbi:MAG: hypothetical protein LBP65_01875 [Puniceicoccales bacterium]|jgi:hypothetical protein|nr:hypothetical protein [Puniceicoccales bacterium]
MRSASLITRVLPETAEKLRRKAARHHLSSSRYIALLVERDLGVEQPPANCISPEEVERRMANRDGAIKFSSPTEALDFLKTFLAQLDV